ncbi:MAG: hypothetical protein GW892_13465 [Armatimonadetes bacterium]|nr:hypothetical protein [Armatimonadota bacterium]
MLAKPLFALAKPLFALAKPLFALAKPLFALAKPLFGQAKRTRRRPSVQATRSVAAYQPPPGSCVFGCVGTRGVPRPQPGLRLEGTPRARSRSPWWTGLRQGRARLLPSRFGRTLTLPRTQ